MPMWYLMKLCEALRYIAGGIVLVFMTIGAVLLFVLLAAMLTDNEKLDRKVCPVTCKVLAVAGMAMLVLGLVPSKKVWCTLLMGSEAVEESGMTTEELYDSILDKLAETGGKEK